MDRTSYHMLQKTPRISRPTATAVLHGTQRIDFGLQNYLLKIRHGFHSSLHYVP